MVSLKIRTLVGIFLSFAVLVGLVWVGLDYYQLRTEHRQMLIYLIQPVKTDAKGNPIQRAQALDELIPRESANGAGNQPIQ